MSPTLEDAPLAADALPVIRIARTDKLTVHLTLEGWTKDNAALAYRILARALTLVDVDDKWHAPFVLKMQDNTVISAFTGMPPARGPMPVDWVPALALAARAETAVAEPGRPTGAHTHKIEIAKEL